MNLLPSTIFTEDNLNVLRGIEDEFVDLIYLDPPFNSNRNYAAPIGSDAAGAAFKDAWSLEDYDAEWMGLIADDEPALAEFLRSVAAIQDGGGGDSKGTQAYLIYMAVRLIEMRRILKPTGSIYLHCDPTASHYLKVVMDCIFGPQHFRNELVWHYKNASRGKKLFAKAHDLILWYTKGVSYTFNRDDILMPYESGMTKWRYEKKGAKAPLGKTPDDVITMASLNAMSKERTGYPTQKPLALLHLIVKASSNPGDLILDPFCGCATACVAAQDTGREWIGIDISPKAADLIRLRFNKELGLISPTIIHRTDIPQRSGQRSRDIKHILYGKQEGRCNGCEHDFLYRNMTVDHDVPTSKGGPDVDDNLQLLCGACNSLKGDRSMGWLKAQLRHTGILRDWK